MTLWCRSTKTKRMRITHLVKKVDFVTDIKTDQHIWADNVCECATFFEAKLVSRGLRRPHEIQCTMAKWTQLKPNTILIVRPLRASEGWGAAAAAKGEWSVSLSWRKWFEQVWNPTRSHIHYNSQWCWAQRRGRTPECKQHGIKATQGCHFSGAL